MARSTTIVKNKFARTLVKLRARLNCSQQSLANMLEIALNTVQRWELNERPSGVMVKRLVDLAMKHKLEDLGDTLCAEYERDSGLSLWTPFAAHVDANLEIAIQLISEGQYQEASEVLGELRQCMKYRTLVAG